MADGNRASKSMKTYATVLAVSLLVGVGTAPVLADNILTNMVKGVVHGTENAAKATMHGTEAVVKGAAHGTEAVVKGAAHGTEAVVKGAAHGTEVVVKGAAHGTEVVVKDVAKGTEMAAGGAAKGAGAIVRGTVHGTEAAVGATGRAMSGAASAVTGGGNHAAQAAATGTASATPAVTSNAPKPASLLGTTQTIKIDHAGNIIDSTGNLVGRVAEVSTDTNGDAVSMAGRSLSVSINSQGQMLDSKGAVVGHVLGYEPKDITPIAPLQGLPGSGPSATPSYGQSAPYVAPQASMPSTSQSASWTEQDAIKEAAPLLHGPLQEQ